MELKQSGGCVDGAYPDHLFGDRIQVGAFEQEAPFQPAQEEECVSESRFETSSSKHASRNAVMRQNSPVLSASTASTQGYGMAESHRDASSRIVPRVASAPSNATFQQPVDPDFALVAEAWSGLSEGLRGRIVAIVRSEASPK